MGGGGGGGGGAGAALDPLVAGLLGARAASLGAALTDEPPADVEEEQLVANLGAHPMMQRVQAALMTQLTVRKQKLEAALRERQEDAARRAGEREQLGVALYGVQQQLSKLQMALEQARTNGGLLADVRVKAEEDLARFRSGFEERKAQVRQEEEKLSAARAELDGIHDAMRAAERFSEEVKREVALTRREAYKAESEISEAEKAKRDQDLYIDDLNEQIKKLGEALALYESQIATQRRETDTAEATLREAAREIETIAFEKKQLAAQWQSTLLDMKRRDEALEATHKALREQEEAYLALNAEESNTRRQIQLAQDAHAKLQEVIDREESQIRFCESSLASIERQRTVLVERADMLKSSLGVADAEVDRLRSAAEALRKEIRDLDHQRSLVDRDRQLAEEGMEENESAQVTARKAARNLARSTKRVLSLVHQKEREKAELENEMARVRVDTLNARVHVEALRGELDRVEAEVKDKEGLVAKFEMEIRQRNDSIEKKMSVVDRLNRKFEALVSSLPEEEHMGPLHAMVHNLSKQIAELRTECEGLQKQWLGEQTALVSAANDVDDKAAQLREMRSQHVLLEQKRIRLEKAVDVQRKEAAELAAGVSRMREDMSRISSLIARNDALTRRLAESNFVTETSFAEELRELERASVETEAQIARLKDEKASLLEDILEAERQIALWEKKIHLERETQEALDPSVGESEVASMEREIHRMRLRHEGLQREQRRLVQELERAIEKRQDIALRFVSQKMAAAAGAASGALGASGGGAARSAPVRPGATVSLDAGGGGAAGGDVTRGGAKKRVTLLRKEVSVKERDMEGYSAAVEEKQRELEAQERRAEEARAALEALEREAAEIQAGINTALYDKQKGVERLVLLRDMERGLRAFRVGERAALHPDRDADAVRASLLREEMTRGKVRDLLESLQGAHPDMADLLDRVMQLTEVAEIEA